MKNHRKTGLAKTLSLMGAIAAAGSGCATTTTSTRTESEPTGKQEIVITDTKYNKENTKQLEILKAYYDKEDGYKADVQETDTERTYKTEYKSKKEQFKEISVESITTERGPVYIGGLVGGAIAGGIIGPKVFQTDDSIDAIVGSFLGAFGGAGLAYLLFPKETTQNRIPGDFSYTTSSLGNERKLFEEKQVYKGAARDISAILSAESKRKETRTSLEGEVYLSEFLESLSPYYFANFSSDKKVMQRFSQIPLIKEIKWPEEQLFAELFPKLYQKKIDLKIETNEKSKNGETVVNDSGTYIIPLGDIPKEAIYSWAENFVNDNIASKIRTVRLDIKDLLSRVPIEACSLEVKVLTQVPSKNDLVKNIFSGSLRNYTVNLIPDYIQEDVTFENVPSKFDISVYSPSTIFLEVTNPEYKFVDGEIEVPTDEEGWSIKKIVYMVDKGSKLIIENGTEQAGRIE